MQHILQPVVTGVFMNKIIQIFTVIFLSIGLNACANISPNKSNSNSVTQWDFDHQVQFIQTQLTERHFQLEIIPNHQVSFERLAGFLIRKSYRLCGGYHYKLEMIKGIENFDDKRAMPNYIFPSLTAKVEC